jgi:hypothetical protein
VYHGELGEVVGGRRVVAADPGDLGARPVLPLGVRGEQHERPGEQQRRRLVPREDERLALVDHQLRVVAELPRRLLLLRHLVQKDGQEPPAVGRRGPALVGDLPAPADGLRQHHLQLAVQPTDLAPVLARKIPAQRVQTFAYVSTSVQVQLLLTLVRK